MSIDAWVTTPAGVLLAHLDRSPSSPFRAFRFFRERNAPGGGSLEYHLGNRIVADTPGLFAKGNLVHMRYRGRTRVWVVRDNGSDLGASEHAGDWVKVVGPGIWPRRRLVFPPGFAAGANLNPASWSTQWRRAINRPAGELLWDLIAESNARFATKFTRGTVETDPGANDGITVDHRFEDIGDDVIPAVLAMRGGDVEFDGLTFNYYRPGHGADRSDEVIFEEGADLVSLRYTSSRREDSVSWVVGEGVGEGVFAKLAIAENAAEPDRREAFFAAKDAGNVPMLDLLTAAALDEHDDDEEALAIEVDESRFRALVDYDMPDTVRVISPSRGVDKVARIEAIYVEEGDDRIRIGFDLGAPRTAEDLALDDELRQTRSQLGLRNRQPQGQLVPFNFNGTGVFDSAEPAIIDFLISDRIHVTIETTALFAFSEYWAGARAASSGGGSTSGASSSSSTSSGGSSSPTSGSSSASSSGASSSSTTSDQSASHSHTIGINGAAGGGLGITRYDYVNGGDFELGTFGIPGDSFSTGFNPITHGHSMPHTHGIGHTHTVDVPAHQHGIAHTHTTPNHAHGLDYGIFKEAMPGSHSVTVGVYKRSGSSWNLVVSLSGLTDEVEELDLTQYIDGPGSWRLEIQSAAGQPSGGRLAVSVSGQVIGAIQSA